MKARTLPFPSLMFLRATPHELVRKRRLKDLLLMAARMAMIVLLALAFARPFLPSEQLPFVPAREAESVVLVVDRSFSMRYDGALDRAITAIRDRIQSAAPGDELAVIAFSDRVDLLAPLSTNASQARGALGSVTADFAATDYLPALQRAADVLAGARHPRRVVVLASDFQDSGWSRVPADWKLPPGVVLEPLSVASREAGNAFVEAFRHTGRRVEGRSAVRFDARVAAMGAAAARTRVATLEVDGAATDRSPLPARSTAPVSFERFAPREGYFQGTLAISDDALPDDDRYYFTHRADAPPVLLVADTPSPSGRSDAFYLRTAFDLGAESRFRFTRAQRPTRAALRESGVAFVSSAANPPDLLAFVEGGGTLILSPSETGESDFARAVEALGAGRSRGIVDVRETQGYEAIIGEVDLRHPIFAPFSGGASLLRPRFRRYVRFEPAEGTTVLGRYDTGDPFVAERRIGSGRLLVYSSTLNAGWTDLPLDESYVPFVYQLAVYGSQRSQEGLEFTVGDAVPLRGEPGSRWEVRTPEGQLFRVTLDESGRGSFVETRIPGHYAAAGGGESRLFSVNVDPAESNLASRDAEEVYAALTAPASGAPDAPRTAAATAAEDESRQKLWRLLLLAAIALFAWESWFANREQKQPATADTPLRRAA